jgi:hypothetical protein
MPHTITYTYYSCYIRSPCQNAGCLTYPCAGASNDDENAVVVKAFRTLIELDLLMSKTIPLSPGGTNAPSPSPTQCTSNCTDEPTFSPITPTSSPSMAPIVVFSTSPSVSPSKEIDVKIARFNAVKTMMQDRSVQLESDVFVSVAPTQLYTLDGFLNALEELVIKGIDGSMFYLGQENGNLGHGLANIAMFLAHAMTRGLKWDTCEEVNHHLLDGKLAISSACGQLGQNYQNNMCPTYDVPMECPVDMTMNVKQTSVGSSNAPPFFCASKEDTPFTGYFDPSSKQTVSDAPFSNAIGREDVSGCCFWGRYVNERMNVSHNTSSHLSSLHLLGLIGAFF